MYSFLICALGDLLPIDYQMPMLVLHLSAMGNANFRSSLRADLLLSEFVRSVPGADVERVRA